MKLHGKVIKRFELKEQQIQSMFSLMNEFYDHTNFDVFMKDLSDKDYCVVLFDEQNNLVGFSTQKILRIPVHNKNVFGVFSGDTIIHKNHWGSMELFKVFSEFFFEYAKQYDKFYWFLIVKGYKTYKILYTFLSNFYPNYRVDTPEYEKEIMDSYARLLFGDEYNPVSGVVEYKGIKDVLKEGVADIDDRIRKDKNVRFFERLNPGYKQGYDLVCLAELHQDAVKPVLRKMLFGE